MMPTKGKCCRCKKEGKVYWANYAPYCSECLAEKSKGAIPFEKAMFDDEDAYDSIQEINKRLNNLEKEVKKLKQKKESVKF